MEDIIFEPIFKFEYVKGDISLINMIQQATRSGAIIPQTSTIVGFKMNTFILPSGIAEGRILVSSSACKSFKIPIYVNITEGTTVGEFYSEFTDSKSFEDTISNLFEKRVFKFETDNDILKNIDSVAGWTLFVLAIFMIIGIYSSFVGWAVNDNIIIDIISKLLIIVILVFATGFIFYWISFTFLK